MNIIQKKPIFINKSINLIQDCSAENKEDRKCINNYQWEITTTGYERDGDCECSKATSTRTEDEKCEPNPPDRLIDDCQYFPDRHSETKYKKYEKYSYVIEGCICKLKMV